MKTLFVNIKQLIGIASTGIQRLQGKEMSDVGSICDAWLLMDNELIEDFGEMPDCPSGNFDEIVDASGCLMFPSFCDSHTHIVYAGSREGEFIDKINGLSYEEIAARGGGILNSADLLHATDEDSLYEQSLSRVEEMMAAGSGAIEIKSGYGLTVEDELKMLRVIRRIKENVPAVIRSTFLGAHAVGRAYSDRKDEYVKLLCDRMIPEAAGLADYIDVFCDEGFFSPNDMDSILRVGGHYGLRGKVHVDEIAVIGGMETAVKHNALSVDHLERTGEDGIQALKDTDTMPVMLPGSSFFLGLPYGRAKDFISAGLGIALASDYNPGSSPSGDMRFVMAQGCIKMRLTPSESFNACTINGAYAMGVSDICGSITAGKLANLILTRPLPSLGFIPYCYMTPFIQRHYLRGKLV